MRFVGFFLNFDRFLLNIFYNVILRVSNNFEFRMRIASWEPKCERTLKRRDFYSWNYIFRTNIYQNTCKSKYARV